MTNALYVVSYYTIFTINIVIIVVDIINNRKIYLSLFGVYLTNYFSVFEIFLMF